MKSAGTSVLRLSAAGRKVEVSPRRREKNLDQRNLPPFPRAGNTLAAEFGPSFAEDTDYNAKGGLSPVGASLLPSDEDEPGVREPITNGLNPEEILLLRELGLNERALAA